MLKMRNPAGVAAPLAAYSHSVEVPAGARWLLLAGQVGVKPDGSFAEGFEAQDKQIWENVTAILDDAGYGVEDIVKLKVLTTERDVLALHMKHRLEYMKGHAPGSTWIGVSHLARPEMLVEMEVIAAKL